MRRNPAMIGSIGALLLAVVIGLPSLAWNLGASQLRSFEIARGWWTQDLLPYRDVPDARLPGIHFVYLLAQLATGGRAWGIRLLELLIVLASARIAAQAAVRRRVKLEELAPVAIFCTAAYYTFADPADSGLEQTWAAVCMLAAQAAVAADRNRRRAAMVSGLWCGTALMLLPRTAVFLPLIAAQLIWSGLKDRPEPEVGPTLVEIPTAFLAGVVQPPFFFASYFVTRHGGEAFLHAASKALELDGAWPTPPPSLIPFGVAFALWAVACAARLRSGGLRAAWPSGVTLLFGAAAVLASPGSGSWIMVVPALWIAAADGLIAIAEEGRVPAAAILAVALIALSPAWRIDPQSDFRRQAARFYSRAG